MSFRESEGIRSFLRAIREEIVAEWNTGPGAVGSAKMLAQTLPDLLEQIALLAEPVERGRPLEETFELARGRVFDSLAGSAEVSQLITELSKLRCRINALWLRRFSDGGVRGLCAIQTAIDALIAAVVSRSQELSEERFARVSSERERVLGKLESLLEASPIGIAFLDRNLRYLRINDSLAALNGRPAKEHLGRTLAEILPDDAHFLEPLLRDVMARNRPVLNQEVQRSSRDDPRDLRTYLFTFFPVHSPSGEVVGAGGIVIDVTENRRTAEDLRVQEARLQQILEHTPSPIWVKDRQGRIVLANHRLAEALGQPFERVIGARSQDLLPPEVAAEHMKHDRVVERENRAIEAEESVPSPKGNRTFLSIKFPLPGDPPLVGAIATEITDRKRMEEDLRLAIRARDSVLAVVSHDLRNPLNTIQLSLATIRQQLTSDQRLRRHHEIIQRSCQRMEHLIEDLLDMASISAGSLKIQPGSELAEEVIKEAAELHQPLAQEKGIELIHRAAPSGVTIRCDRRRVMQVFANLIGNALKFCRCGDTVTLDCEDAGENVRFSVEDTGPGIAPELVQHLFDPYWSGPTTRSGAGLGLYIARGIVERHEGRIYVESTVGKGTRFFFTIPKTRA